MDRDWRRKRSQDLRAEALRILHEGILGRLEEEVGAIEIAGSVALDLMAWPDIDLYTRLEATDFHRLTGFVPKMAEQLERQGYALAEARVVNEHVLPDPKFPMTPGLYGGFTFVSRESGRKWKIDLWGWSSGRYEERRTHHLELQKNLRGADRDMILRLKEADGYGESFSSVDVYAFAVAGAGDSLEDFRRFLLKDREQT